MNIPYFRMVQPADALRCFEIESMAYQGCEAATLDRIIKRAKKYPYGFIVMEMNGQIIGFINSGCANEVIMSNDGIKELIGHDPLAPNVVITSVVIDPIYQGKGFASLLMKVFVEYAKKLGKETIHLMCKERHIGLYKHLGYQYVKPSESSHGGMAWHEMVMKLNFEHS